MKGIQNIETDRAFTLEELEQFMNDHYSRKGQFWHENRGIPPKNPDLERYCESAAGCAGKVGVSRPVEVLP